VVAAAAARGAADQEASVEGGALIFLRTSGGGEHAQYAVVGFPVRQGDPHAVARVSARQDVGVGKCCKDLLPEPVRCPQPVEVGLAVRDVPAGLAQGSDNPGAFFSNRISAGKDFVLRGQRRHCGGLGHAVDAERDGRAPESLRHGRPCNGVTDSQPGQAVGLGEGPQDAEVWKPPVEIQGVHLRPALEFDVRLVQDHQNMGRHRPQELLQRIGVDGHAGGVVRRAQDHQTGAFRDSSRHGGEVVVLVVQQRDGDRLGAGHGHQDGIRLEGPPGENHIVAVVTHRRDELLQHPRASRPGGNLIRGNAEMPGDGLARLHGAHARVAVNASCLRGDHVDDGRQGCEVAFVRSKGGGQFGLGAPAGNVGGKFCYGGTKPRCRGFGKGAGHASIVGQSAAFAQHRLFLQDRSILPLLFGWQNAHYAHHRRS
jgi:hypothetical protein